MVADTCFPVLAPQTRYRAFSLLWIGSGTVSSLQGFACPDLSHAGANEATELDGDIRPPSGPSGSPGFPLNVITTKRQSPPLMNAADTDAVQELTPVKPLRPIESLIRCSLICWIARPRPSACSWAMLRRALLQA